jgi:hypothetical protein
MFGRPIFGWLPWPPEVSKKFVLSRNVLVISWPFIAHSKKVKSKFFFQKNKFLKKITLNILAGNEDTLKSPPLAGRSNNLTGVVNKCHINNLSALYY